MKGEKISKPRRSSGGKATSRIELDRRITDVEQLVGRGLPRAVILTAVRQKYGQRIGASTIDNYIKQVRERWLERRAEEREFDRAMLLEQLAYDIQELRRAKAYGPMIAARRIQADVMGLRAPDIHLHPPAAAPAPQLDLRSYSDAELQELMRLVQKGRPLAIADTTAIEAKP